MSYSVLDWKAWDGATGLSWGRSNQDAVLVSIAEFLREAGFRPYLVLNGDDVIHESSADRQVREACREDDISMLVGKRSVGTEDQPFPNGIWVQGPTGKRRIYVQAKGDPLELLGGPAWRVKFVDGELSVSYWDGSKRVFSDILLEDPQCFERIVAFIKWD